MDLDQRLAGRLNRTYALFVVLWTALIGVSLWFNLQRDREDTYATAVVAARANINKDIAFRKWASSHGGVYVTPNETTPPNPYLKVPNRDVVTTTGTNLTLMNPAYMLREMMHEFSQEYGIISKITSLKPLNPNNKPDEWEEKALKAFEQGKKVLTLVEN